ncbi:MAG: hypothetical protein H0V73_11660 [Chloroflexi bacterium]|nr:hypothetical protein [Chloroflexota bacterium]
MSLILLVLTSAQLLDLGTFVVMVRLHGPAAEANPLVGHLLISLGLPFVAVAKVALLSVVVAIMAILIGREEVPAHGRLVGVIVTVGIVAGLLGAWSNAGVIL